MIRALLPLLFVLLSTFSVAQDWTRTTTQRAEGERKFVVTGVFTGADTVLVQVYHDGKELHSEAYAGTFMLEFGTYRYYVVKFTDVLLRVKYLYILELSDDLIEFYPPIEIDFERQGNMALIKPTNQKPDWQEFDVGLGRKPERD